MNLWTPIATHTQFFLKESNLLEHDHPKLDEAVIEFENERESETKKRGKLQGDGDIETMKKIKNRRNTSLSTAQNQNQKYLGIHMNHKI